MKYLYIGLLILCLLLCACYLSTREVRDRTEALTLPLRQAVQAFRTGNLAERARLVAEAGARWAESEAFFASLLSHEKTSQVSEDLRRLSVADGDEFEQTCLRLLDSLDRIRRMDLPILENIL